MTTPKTDQRDDLSFTPPPLSSLNSFLALHNAYFKPEFFGLENVDKSQPALYVGNHSIYAILDTPLIYQGLYEHKDIVLRGLGDSFHFDVPFWGDLMKRNGVVEGTRDNCHRLMDMGEHIMVFPGGAREAMKRKNEQYRLTWKARTGFAHMAMSHGYPIIPVAALGADDAYDIHYDAYDFKASFLGRTLLNLPKVNKALRNGDVFPPIISGVGNTLLPRPETFYFSFGAPIQTAHLQQQADDREEQWQVRKSVMLQLQQQLESLKQKRRRAPRAIGWRKFLQEF